MKVNGIPFQNELIARILTEDKTQTRRLAPVVPELVVAGLPWTYYRGHKDQYIAAQHSGQIITSRYGGPGDRIWTRENLWISECGQYYARPVRGSCVNFDILSRDGKTIWWGNRYDPKDWNDPKLLYPEFEHMTLGYSNMGRMLRSGRRIEAFDLTFGDMDISKMIIPGHGNTIIKQYEAQFRKQWPSIHAPRFASAALLEITSARLERLGDISEADAKAEGVRPAYQSQGEWWRPKNPADGTYREGFFAKWDEIHGRESRDKNPYLWVYAFKLIETHGPPVKP